MGIGQFGSIGMLPHANFAAITADQVSAVTPGPSSPETVRAWPNPFADRVSLAFSLPFAGPAQLEIFDISGRRVWSSAKKFLGPGRHILSWHGATESGARASAGRYFMRLRGPDLETTKAVIRLK